MGVDPALPVNKAVSVSTSTRDYSADRVLYRLNAVRAWTLTWVFIVVAAVLPAGTADHIVLETPMARLAHIAHSVKYRTVNLLFTQIHWSVAVYHETDKDTLA